MVLRLYSGRVRRPPHRGECRLRGLNSLGHAMLRNASRCLQVLALLVVVCGDQFWPDGVRQGARRFAAQAAPHDHHSHSPCRHWTTSSLKKRKRSIRSSSDLRSAASVGSACKPWQHGCGQQDANNKMIININTKNKK